MRRRRIPLVVLMAAALSLLRTADSGAQASAQGRRLQWLVPTLLPPGARLAVISGDPTAPGECTLELSLPNGYRLPPHYHPSYEHDEVQQGTLLIGMGDRLDPKLTKPLAAGDSAMAPAGMHHFSIAKGRTVLLVRFNGPYTITYLRAEDAPRPPVFPQGD